jgi:hypothetical protein
MEHHYAGLRRQITDETRANVVKDFPEIALTGLRDRPRAVV